MKHFLSVNAQTIPVADIFLHFQDNSLDFLNRFSIMLSNKLCETNFIIARACTNENYFVQLKKFRNRFYTFVFQALFMLHFTIFILILTINLVEKPYDIS